VFIVTFCAGFDGFLFVSLTLTVSEAFVNFNRKEPMSHEVDFAVKPNSSP
jgi:hypothetical protein